MDSRPFSSSLSARWSLQGRTALVTGGTRGIGKAIVEELAGLGASVYTCARTAAHLEERLKQWKDAGFAVEGSICDATSAESRIQLVQEVSGHFDGKLDILVHNVGGPTNPKPTTDVPKEDYDFAMATNLESAFHLSQLSHPLLKASGRGRMVFISSVGSFITTAIPFTVYQLAKAGMNQLTRALAVEWVKDGILVNAVAPGLIATELTAEVIAGQSEKIVKDIPLGRTGEPQEVAAAVAFLCMPCSSFVMGSMLVVDGGTAIRPAFS